MQVIENASVVCRSLGENNVIIVCNENTGKEITLQNPAGIEVELGMQGRLTYQATTMVLGSFEPVMEEELVS